MINILAFLVEKHQVPIQKRANKVYHDIKINRVIYY